MQKISDRTIHFSRGITFQTKTQLTKKQFLENDEEVHLNNIRVKCSPYPPIS